MLASLILLLMLPCCGDCDGTGSDGGNDTDCDGGSCPVLDGGNCPSVDGGGCSCADGGSCPALDAGCLAPGTKADGEACQADAECLGGLCLTEAALGWSHGYCSQLCAEAGDPPLVACQAGSTCARLPAGFYACLTTCAQPSDCRDATYDCVQVSANPLRKACSFEACTSNAECAGGCDLDNNRCTATPENCVNSSDDDGDGLLDCEELDCAAGASCSAPVAAACTAAIDVSAGGTFNGDTASGSSLFAGSCGDALFGVQLVGSAHHENVYKYVAATAIRTSFTLHGQSGAVNWYTRTNCDDSTTQVRCGTTDATAPSTLTVDFATGDTQYFYVDSDASDATYQLTVEAQNFALLCQTATVTTVGDTAGDFADGSFAFVGSCGGDGSVLVFRYTPAATGPIGVQATPGDANMDLALYARTSCADTGTELRCADYRWGGEVEVLPALNVTSGVPIYLFVQNWGGKTGTFTLNITVY